MLCDCQAALLQFKVDAGQEAEADAEFNRGN